MAKFSFRRESDAPRARRFTELFLLVLAVGISSFGMYLIDPEHAFDTSKSQWLPCTVVLGAGALLIHLVMQFRARYADPFILPLVVALNGIGLTMIYRLDPQIAAPVGDGQLMWTGVSMVLCAIIVFVLRDYRLLRKVTYTSLVLSMILLIMPLVPGLGMELNGARIWIHIGNRTFQPGEVAKITLAIFFAGYLATHRDLILVAGRRIGPINLPRLRDLAPVFLAWIVSLGVLVFRCCTCRPVVFRGWWLRVSVWLWAAISRTTMSRTCTPVFMRGCMLLIRRFTRRLLAVRVRFCRAFSVWLTAVFLAAVGARAARTSSRTLTRT